MTIINVSSKLSSNRAFTPFSGGLQFKSRHSGGLQFLSGTSAVTGIGIIVQKFDKIGLFNGLQNVGIRIYNRRNFIIGIENL